MRVPEPSVDGSEDDDTFDVVATRRRRLGILWGQKLRESETPYNAEELAQGRNLLFQLEHDGPKRVLELFERREVAHSILKILKANRIAPIWRFNSFEGQPGVVLVDEFMIPRSRLDVQEDGSEPYVLSLLVKRSMEVARKDLLNIRVMMPCKVTLGLCLLRAGELVESLTMLPKRVVFDFESGEISDSYTTKQLHGKLVVFIASAMSRNEVKILSDV